MKRIECILAAVFVTGAVHGFTLVSHGSRARVLVGESEPGYVLRAAQDFTNDVKKITGVDLELARGAAPRAGDVFVATRPRDEWEAYEVSVKGGVLTVEGSDPRGTMFGLYDFIERYLKVDPLAFWNGTPYPKADALAWDAVEIRQASPTFRFRGWFINDEDLLTAWMPSGGKRYIDYPFYSDVVNPGVMEHVAEALVRSRYNLIIPASFINIMNPPEARLVDICAARGVYLSMHHVEPMGVSAFTFFKYWKDRGKDLKYSYYSNPREIEEVWRAAAERWAKYPNVIWQIGLRGVADRPMWRADPDTPKDDAARAAIISSAMAKQVSILDEVGVPKEGRLVSTTLWAEGSVFNQKGYLTIPDGTIVVFADNCAGWAWPPDFHQTARIDRYRYGVYYHHGLIGSGPHLASLVPAAKTYDMMRQAREKGSSTYAIFNVSDIREFVYGIDATAKMLWNLDAFDPEAWTKDWIARHYSARRGDWLTAYNTYYHALALHPTSGQPVFLDGLLKNRGCAMIRQMTKGLERVPKIAPEPFVRSYEPLKGKDAFYEALAAVVGPPIDNPRDAYARLASQTATYTLAAELARGLYAGLPAGEREFAFTTLVYPAELMRDLSDWCGELIRTHESLAVGDRASARAHAEAALARMDAILARAKDYCKGQWKNWYRDCRKINLKELREQTYALLARMGSEGKLCQTPAPKCRYADACDDGRPAARWRGFNLLEMFYKGGNAKPREFLESDFRMMHDWGFNFARLPMDYRFWIVDGDWEKIDESAVAYIDRAIALGRKWGVHVQVCMHRCPGYTVARPHEERDLFADPEAQRVCALHWAYFAKRWKGIPNEALSFNLFNEPPNVAPEKYAHVVKVLVDAIRREDPKRFIVLDGLSWGKRPLAAAYGLKGVGQATRGYEPMSVSHYLAPWVGTPSAKPVWPLSLDAPAGLLAGRGKPDLRAPLEVSNVPPCRVDARWSRVSGPVKVRFAADGKTVAEAAFDPKPGATNWKGVKYYPEWKIHQGAYTGTTSFELPAGARDLAVEVASGDWIELASLTFTAPDGRAAELAVRSEWSAPKNFRQAFKGFGASEPFASLDAASRPRRYADAGREYLYRRMIEPWEEALANGTFVMAGEFGVWKMTPHDIVLDVFEDYLALWKERNMGWALWNLRGSIGVLDSERADVEYEDYEGHKLDRKMLDLLQRY